MKNTISIFIALCTATFYGLAMFLAGMNEPASSTTFFSIMGWALVSLFVGLIFWSLSVAIYKLSELKQIKKTDSVSEVTGDFRVAA